MPTKELTDRCLSMQKIRTKARGLGITPGKMNKVDLIHAIQIAEGNTPCYGRANGVCPYTICCFMDDCLKIKL
jgi:hypothetical protein